MSQNRKSLGRLSAPIEVTKAYYKACNFDHQDIEVLSWIGITPTGSAYQCNTYNGKIGKNANPNQRDAKGCNLKGYTEVESGGALPDWLKWA